MIYYVLEDGKVVETEDPSVLEAAMVTGRNKVGDTQISERIRVSTQLMGIDLNVPGMLFPHLGLPSKLFETCVLGGDNGVQIFRYSTLEEAQKGHENVCETERQRLAAKP